MDDIIRISGLSKSYDQKHVIENINIHVPRGKVFGLLGANGAGKSTTIECVLGTRKADAGTVSILGLDPRKNRKELFEQVGVQFQEANYPDRIKVKELCQETACLYKNPADYQELLKKFDLDNKANAPVSQLSGGQKQRLFIILALIPDPKVVFLDELTTGLDIRARRSVWKSLMALKARGLTIFLSSHYMDEVATLCDTIGILKDGQFIFTGTVNEAIEQSPYDTLEDAYLWFTGEEAEIDDKFFTMLKTELKLSFRGIDMIIFALCMPLVMVLILGAIYGDRPAFEGAGYTFMEQSFGAIATIAICAGGVMGLPLVVSDYRQKKILKRYQVTPGSPLLILGVQVAIYAIYSLVSLVLVYLASTLIFGVHFSGSLPGFLLAYFLVMLSIFSIGMMVGGVARDMKAASVVASILYFPMVIFSGATLPYEAMPAALQKVADILPLTQGIKLLKAASLGLAAEVLWVPLMVMVGMVLVYKCGQKKLNNLYYQMKE